MDQQELRSDLNDSEIVAAVRAGDTSAFRSIYERYRDRVHSVVFFTCGDGNQAEDLVQTVFLKAFRAMPGFRFESSLGTWLISIAINEARNVRARSRPPGVPLEALLGSGDEIDARSVLPDEFYAQGQRQTILQQAVLELSPKLREVVVLRFVEGLSYDEISDVLGCASGTVASRLHRALAELQSKLHLLKRVL